MSPPPVLLIEPDRERRRFLSRGLAAEAFEVIPCADAAQGSRYAESLEGAVIVIPAAGGAELAARLCPPGAGRRAVLLGDAPGAPAELPDAVAYVAVKGLAAPAVLTKILLLLVGEAIGVEADDALGSLVGDLAERPLLELLRALGAARVSGRLELPGGALHFSGGEPIAAEASGAGGRKAFCRLARLDEGPFRIVLGRPSRDRELEGDLDSLIVEAIGDALVELPAPQELLTVRINPRFFDTPFTALGREILTAAHHGVTVGELLDGLAATDGEIVQELWALEAAGLLTRAEPKPAILVVTDSTADLPRAVAREHGIVVVPLAVEFGGERFHDRVDLEPLAFYELLESRAEPPAFHPPSRRELAAVFTEHLTRRDVVAVHLSEKLSQTVVNARAAAEAELAAVARSAGEAAVAPVLEVIDSRQVSLGLGMLALFAARMAARGLAAREVADRLAALRERVHTLFLVDTLESLARGGRIGTARAWVGKLLRIKPILGLADGEVVPVAQVRGGRAAPHRILELLAERCPPTSEVVAGIALARAPAWADRLRQLLAAEYRVRELILGEMGPVVGALAGPGTVGVALFAPTPEEAELLAPLG